MWFITYTISQKCVLFAPQPRHWRALFIGLGQDYDPAWEFTVADLLSFNLGRYKDLIASVCAGAAAEYALEVQLTNLTRAWQERDFKLAKHIPLMGSRLGSATQSSAAKTARKNKADGKEVGGPPSAPRHLARLSMTYALLRSSLHVSFYVTRPDTFEWKYSKTPYSMV